MTCLTFVIPIRHQENSENWNLLIENLKQTIRSICAQKNSGWKAIIVANLGARLPELPKNFDVCFVNFPTNKLYIRGSSDLEVFREEVRLDKGRRQWAERVQRGHLVGKVTRPADRLLIAKR